MESANAAFENRCVPPFGWGRGKMHRALDVRRPRSGDVLRVVSYVDSRDERGVSDASRADVR